MDPYRYRPPSSRYGKSSDLSLLSVFVLTLLLLVGVVAALTAGSAWSLPDLPSIQPVQTRTSGLFGASAIDRPPQPAAEPPASPTSAPAAANPTASPTPPATATTAPTATPAQSPTATPAAEPPKVFVIGNTGGVGAWLRRTPRINDYLIAWTDGTRMEVVGPDVQADGRTWRHVKDPRGNEGYLPAEWLVSAP